MRSYITWCSPILARCGRCRIVQSWLFLYLQQNTKHDCALLTRFCHSLNRNILFIGHEAQHREDSKACYEAGAAVQTAQHDAVPYGQDRKKEDITLLWAVNKPYTGGNTDFCAHVVWGMETLRYKMCRSSIHPTKNANFFFFFFYL